MDSIFVCNRKDKLLQVFDETVVRRLSACLTLDKDNYTYNDIAQEDKVFAGVRFIFSTWGMPSFTEEEIRHHFPDLECVFYAAGTVQAFAKPFIACGINVFSAWAANAVPVAEYTVAQIILANKGCYREAALMKQQKVKEAQELVTYYPGNYQERVGIIGAGMIGSLVAKMLRPYQLDVWAYDPFMPEELARQLGITLCSLESLFSNCRVVSNHLANNAQTQGILKYSHFTSMLPYATFINTGRGAQVVEDDLVRVLRERPDLTAILDVTDPEPPLPDHPFYHLENCVLTPHMAGSMSKEVQRMAVYMAEECEAYLKGLPLRYRVTMDMLKTMA